MKRFGTILLGAMLAMCMTGMHACSSQPTTLQQTGVTVLVTAAVAVTVQKDTQDVNVWAKRAGQILDVAKELQSIDEGTVATLPGLIQVLTPLIEKANLSPGARAAANTLTLTLAQLIEANRRRGTTEQASIRLVLQTVIDTASLYVPLAPA